MREYKVLLVEDDEVDVMTVERAFQTANIANPLLKARDGLEALAMLRGENGHLPCGRPLIILLDLNMPLMNGLEFLAEVKSDPSLRDIPVVVLTSSENDEDITRAYRSQVAGYLTKPVGIEKLIEKMAALGKYWTLCELP